MSVPEARSVASARAAFTCASLASDIIELVALRDRTQVLRALGARRGLSFPAFGRIVTTRDMLVLGVRPERWLLLTPPAPPGAALANWQGACAACAAAVELSSALTALHLTGPAVREVLARGCRLDLHPDAFAPGTAAASHVAQVPVVLGALPAGWLLLTPSSTARHFREWLSAAGAPFGLDWRGSVTVATLPNEEPT